MGDIANDVEYGRMVVQEGGLKVLRELLGVSRSWMASLLYTDKGTYANWEIWPEVDLTPGSAGRVGRFYRAAMYQIEYLIEEGVDPKTIMPLHEYARQTGTPNEVLFRMYRGGMLDCIDLGVLGLWIKR